MKTASINYTIKNDFLDGISIAIRLIIIIYVITVLTT
ncbi:hypothetical protein BH23BAC3_BH23BAC3_20170 [soil metagenome]